MSATCPSQHVKINLTGVVQGVGFRPFISRLAQEVGVRGQVRNSQVGVELYLVGHDKQILAFTKRIECELPVTASIESMSVEQLSWQASYTGFSISQSDSHYYCVNTPSDVAMCKQCLAEINEPSDRRYRFAFNTCADCGPRYSVINAMPYDRTLTTNDRFPLCDKCLQEYSTPSDRRFHVEGIGCPDCGPGLEFIDVMTCQRKSGNEAALKSCVDMVLSQKIVAVKGMCGFHLCCDATNEYSIETLRERKKRPAKPLAIMMKDVEQVKQYFSLSADEERLLLSAQAPIVMLSKQQQRLPLADALAPGVNCIGVMLAFTPLHFLIMSKANRPLVMTSGNTSGEPVCYENKQALHNLSAIVDGFLLHNRDIAQPSDDSVVRVMANTSRLIRRSRGFVPRPVTTKHVLPTDKCILALGADLKHCLAINKGSQVVLSAHNGDLSHPDCLLRAKESANHLIDALNVSPDAVVVDSHPDYQSTRLGEHIAKVRGIPLLRTQHHHAHMIACLTENEVSPDKPVLGIILDGLGYGEDKTFWGGELLLADIKHCHRLGSLSPFPLLGFDLANKQPWRNLVAQLLGAGFSPSDICAMCDTVLPDTVSVADINSLCSNHRMFPLTSSAGRLFDAVAALLGAYPVQRFEGEAAMLLEALAHQAVGTGDNHSKPLPLFDTAQYEGRLILSTTQCWQALLQRWRDGVNATQLAYQFHQCFADSWVQFVCSVAEKGIYTGETIALSGGVFQNKIILERMLCKLQQAGFNVVTHQHVPSNDGGIALGQLAIGAHQMRDE